MIQQILPGRFPWTQLSRDNISAVEELVQSQESKLHAYFVYHKNRSTPQISNSFSPYLMSCLMQQVHVVLKVQYTSMKL